MRMIQTEYPCDQPWVEIFYDGQVKVENNVVSIPRKRAHWRDVLLTRGFRDLPDVVQADTLVVEDVEPKKQPRRRKKVSDGDSQE